MMHGVMVHKVYPARSQRLFRTVVASLHSLAVVLVASLFSTSGADFALACEAMQGEEYADPPEVVRLDLSPTRWHVARRTRTSAYARKEWVQPDQSLADWSRLVTWHVAFGLDDTDLSKAQSDFLESLRTGCTSHAGEDIQTNPSDRIFEWWDEGCFGRPAQHQLVRLVRGSIGVHTVSYTFKGGRFAAEERARWIGRIASVPLSLRNSPAASNEAIERIYIDVWKGRYEAAFSALEPLSEAGDAEAQALQAQLYVEGWGVEQDYEKARSLLELASATGNARAAFDLGQLHEAGLGVPVDPAQALELYRLAAERGLPDAQGRVGYLLLNGPPELADPAGAYRWFELALTNGHMHARYWLGRLHEIGIGAEKDVLRAAELYSQAARDGEPDAQYRLGILYATGNTVRKDMTAARLWLMRAAGQGNESARNFYKQLEATDS